MEHAVHEQRGPDLSVEHRSSGAGGEDNLKVFRFPEIEHGKSGFVVRSWHVTECKFTHFRTFFQSVGSGFLCSSMQVAASFFLELLLSVTMMHAYPLPGSA